MSRVGAEDSCDPILFIPAEILGKSRFALAEASNGIPFLVPISRGAD